MQYDRLPFPEAVEDLAGRFGLTVPHEGGSTVRSPADDLAPLYELLGGSPSSMQRLCAAAARP